jgi:hypothetical protein
VPATPAAPPATPDFASIYVFLAAVMDPAAPQNGSHLVALRAMSPLDRETAVLLMHHLVRNLTSRTMWETQMKLVCEGKPSFITAHTDGSGGGGGGGGSSWGALAEAPLRSAFGGGGGGDDDAAVQAHAAVAAARPPRPHATHASVYARPFAAPEQQQQQPPPPPEAPQREPAAHAAAAWQRAGAYGSYPDGGGWSGESVGAAASPPLPPQALPPPPVFDARAVVAETAQLGAPPLAQPT